MADLSSPALRGRRSVLFGLAALAAGVVVDAVVPIHAQGARMSLGARTAGPGVGSTGTRNAVPDGASDAAPDNAPVAAPDNAPAVEPAPAAAPAPPVARAAPTEAELVAEFSGRRPTDWGLAVAGVITSTPAPQLALTFDACGGPGGAGCDHRLLETLRRLGIPATLFVNQRWVEANPGVARELAADPLFELANHGSRHCPLSVTGRRAYGIPGTSGVGQAYHEIMDNQAVLQGLTGRPARFFRPGTAFYDDVAVAITRRAGLLPVNFSINADAGATLPAPAVAAALAKASAGDIVIAHFNKPGSGTAAGFEQALPRMLARGAAFAQLGRVLPAGAVAL
ncbi:polysaccharide deacetylase family protein [Arthrobacter sp. UKPF54-2]|uniref:polysaccharide deacetylase family protein n=1 Tax=Arthrobacter sp. UKPF54-2 TaxID=2600159 RepID=UPI0021BD4A13|nr:polysaccharide deacetylase family protein [Arthrobacter sp. UKPF54-2]